MAAADERLHPPLDCKCRDCLTSVYDEGHDVSFGNKVVRTSPRKSILDIRREDTEKEG